MVPTALATRLTATLITTLIGAFAPPALAAGDDGKASAPITDPTSLLRLQPWRTQIAAPAYGSGNGGAGVTVGLADTGVDVLHPALRGQVVAGRNVVTGTGDISDPDGHGTHVAGLIAGRLSADSPIAGLAPNARLAVARVFADAGATTSERMDQGVRWLVERARVPIINLSLGSASPGDTAAIAEAVRRGTLIVAAAGNAGADRPGWPAAFATQPWAAGRMIAVGSVDAANQLSTFSNRAGDARYAFVVAPGENVASAYPDNRYATMSGTSMATPLVAAQAALIKSTWRYLPAERIADVIFRSATDLGAPGVDPVYGWGLVNVERSLQPIGSLGLTLPGRGRVTLGSGVSAAPATMGATGGAAALSTFAYDDTGRHFAVSPGNTLARSTPLSLETVFGPGDRLVSAASTVLSRGLQITTVTDAPRFAPLPPGVDPTAQPYPTVRAMMLAWREDSPDGPRTLAAGTGGMAGYSFGLAASSLGDALAGSEPALSSPLLRFAANHDHVAVGLPFSTSWSLRVGGATSRTPFVPAQGSVGLVEISREDANQVVTLGWSQLQQPSVLGATLPTLGFAQDSRTQAVTLAAARRLSEGFALAGSYHVARTDELPGGAPGSLLDAASSVRASGFGVAAVWSDVGTARDRLSLGLSSPLRADAGTLQYSVISAVDPDTGAAQRGVQTVSARPSGREKLAELRYLLPTGRGATLQLSLAARLQPDHDAQAPTQRLIALRYLARF